MVSIGTTAPDFSLPRADGGGEVALKDFGRADFEAWVRKLDTVDRSWRE